MRFNIFYVSFKYYRALTMTPVLRIVRLNKKNLRDDELFIRQIPTSALQID